MCLDHLGDRRGMPQLKRVLAWFTATAPLMLLGASALLTAALAWQAATEARSHRELAARVLHDYAALAATEFSRRTTAFIGNYGVLVGLRALTQASHDNAALPSRQAIQAALPEQSQRAIEFVGVSFRFNAHGSEPSAESARLSPHIYGALRAATERAPTSSVLSVHTTDSSQTRLFVLTPLDRTAETTWVGFEVPMATLTAWFGEFIARDPLLPPTLVANETARSSLVIDVRAPNGHVIFRSHERAAPNLPLATLDLGGTPAITGLQDFRVEISLDPAVAPRLIIGGLPRSQTAFLLGLAMLSAALAFAAALQIRRERRHADMRRDFVTRASHELRTPVARIRMFTETLLLDRVRSDAERQQTLQALDRGARRLSILIDNVLQLSSIQATSASHLQSIDAAVLIREIVYEFETGIYAASRIAVSGPPCAEVTLDGEALRQILTNLLDNAWKYGGSPPQVRVEFAANGSELTLAVEDNGTGVPEGDRGRIWEPYVRLDHRHSSIAGTGIGLAVVKELVHRCGGSCDVVRGTAGARFIVTLPVAWERVHAVATT